MNTRNLISTALGALVFGCVVTAQPALPSAFKSRTVTSPDGASIFVRTAGTGPVVVLLHGYAETSDSWAPLATELIVPRASRPLLHGGRSLGSQAAIESAGDAAERFSDEGRIRKVVEVNPR